VAGTGKSAGDPLGLQIGPLGPTLGPILEPILEPRPFELVASIRVAGKQPGPASPQPAETGGGLIGDGCRPSGLAVAELVAGGGAQRRLLPGVLGKGVAMPLVLVASGAIAL